MTKTESIKYGFGSKEKTLLQYTDENVQWTKEFIQTTSANYGGTNIYSPMEDVLLKDKKSFKAGDKVILKGLTGMYAGMIGTEAVI